MPVAPTVSVVDEPDAIAVDCGCVEIAGASQADCDTLIAIPATFTTPLLAALMFAESENVSVPLPLPLGFEVSVIHGVGVEALQAQLPLAVMVIVPLPAVGPNVNDIGEAV